MLRRLLDSPVTYFVGAGLLVLVAIATQIDVRLPSKPLGSVQDLPKLREREPLNLVLIVIDTLRADRLGAYGYERPTSPNMDALAHQGIMFKNVLAQSSWTKTSMASLWTGAHAVNHGILRFDDALPPDAVMPAEILHDAGYRTAGVVRNGWIAPNFGFGQGFDFYLRPLPGRSRVQAQSRSPGGPVLEGTDEDVLLSAFDFLDSFGREKFFLYMHLMDVHQYVYDQESPAFGNSYSDAYDQSIHWVDRIVKNLYLRLEEMGQIQNTIIVVASDHGEAFREHGFEGHARNLYREVVRVPWIISLPFRLDPGVVVEEPVSNIDIWPTLLDLMGLPGLESPDGHSALPLISRTAGLADVDESFSQPRFTYLDRGWGQRGRKVPNLAIEQGNKRVIWWPPVPDSVERVLFFDTQSDPGEQNDLYHPGDPDAEPLLELAREHYQAAKSPWGVQARRVELDEMRLNQLRALGYALPGEKPRRP